MIAMLYTALSTMMKSPASEWLYLSQTTGVRHFYSTIVSAVKDNVDVYLHFPRLWECSAWIQSLLLKYTHDSRFSTFDIFSD